MKRLLMVTFGVIALGWTAGCCHSWGSCCSDWNDGCYSNSACGELAGDCHQKNCQKKDCRCQRDRCRKDKCRRGNDCCDPCGGSEYSGMVLGSSGYDSSVPMAAPGCSGCADGGASFSPGVVSGGCASGNCGSSAPTYGGMPIDPSSGWTIQPFPAPATSEPVQAPPAGGSPSASGTTLTPIPASSGSVPPPTPITPPVGSAR